MNLNKLFPRLSIRAKLQVAFVLLAILPLAVAASLASLVTVDRLRALGREMLQHDLETTRGQVLLAIQSVEAEVTYLGESLLAGALCGDGPLEAGDVARVRDYLRDRSEFFQVRAVRRDGVMYNVLRASPIVGEGDGTYYLFRTVGLAPGRHLALPVEVLGDPADTALQPVAALAVIAPVYRGDARCGLAVGEAYAARVFHGLEEASFNLTGVTVLMDPNGFFLYHSERKRTWNRLVAAASEIGGAPWVPPAPPPPSRPGSAAAVSGELYVTQGSLVASTTIPLPGGTGLQLFRAVPARTVLAPIRQFMLLVGGLGLLLTLAVVILARLAAGQLTRPVIELRDAATRLTQGDPLPALDIQTNDELEDLALSFARMDRALTEHRHRLEELVEERTRELKETHAELGEILAHSADAIVGLDAGGAIRVWNRGAERLLGYRADEVLGRQADQLLQPPDDGGVEARFIARELAEHGAVVNLSTRRLAKGGPLVPVSVTQTTITDPSGRPAGTSLILRDTSLQTELEERMRRSERLAAVSLMAAGLAHELNNPIAIITNRIECMEAELAENGPSADWRRDLRALREHAVRLGEITRNLLRFGRGYDEAPTLVDLAQMVRRIMGLLAQSFAGRGVTIHFTDPGPIPPVEGSEPALEALVLNLVTNAADAMPGGGTVTVSLAAAGEEALTLVVEDQGAGIPAELRAKVFEPFYTTKGARLGMGLGLALCRSVVERHRGTIRVESAEGRGARFVVRLPAEPARVT